MFNKDDCAPGNRNGSGSCLPKRFLIKIANILNNKENCNINVKLSKTKLHDKISNELNNISQCSKEACWLNISNIKKNLKPKVYKSIVDYFKPFMPESWQIEPYKWLNTNDINNVLQQYEVKYPKFKYYGAIPIDFSLKKNGNCIVSELCKIDIGTLKNENIESFGIVFNTDPHNMDGKHWFSMFVDLKGKNRKNKPSIYHYDSVASEPYDEIIELVNKIKSQYKDVYDKEIDFLFNDKKHQNGTTECGIYCLHFLIYMLRGNLFKNYINNKKTDEQIHKFRDKFYIKCKS